MTFEPITLKRALTALPLIAAFGAHPAGLEAVPDTPPAPALPTATIDGDGVTRPDFEGDVLLINFWAGWCPPCLHEMPALQRLAERFQGKPFRVLAVNVGEDARRVRETLRRLDYRGMVLLDSDSTAFDAWDVQVLPTSFVVDAHGRICLRVVGELDWEDRDIDRMLNEIIGSQSALPD
jgi:thiol-disulfide isomerase/thioredoxin